MTEPRIQALCRQIIDSHEREIRVLKALMQDIEQAPRFGPGRGKPDLDLGCMQSRLLEVTHAPICRTMLASLHSAARV